MQRVSYGGESFITSDDGAAALLDFAASAAMSAVGEVVSLPIVLEDGRVVSVRLVIGPSSELLTTPIESSLPEPDTRDAAAALRARASQLGATSAHAFGGPISGTDLDAADPATGDLELY
ncbi:hypothetical protein F1C58_08885 [Glaciihabitans sp. INWT7]|uniref:hypothetical protein n=1 Tax=Glaciihabitans sp. INWT7 TaxID=2596912 RepID=UPI001623C19F|nr:hypothetical protein [Glaciihabitans sp. INWT7]QNE47002.1 hypothetical protein F1C58_08885 [Glaciihabitans sp. INWT7]